MCNTNCNFDKFQNSVNVIYTVRHIGNNALNFFAIVSMVRITAVKISKKLKCRKKLRFRKVSKRFKYDLHSVRHVRNNDLNSVCQSLHCAHHRSTNFEKAIMCKRNSYFEKFQNSLNVICTERHIGNNDLNSFCHS